MLNSREHFLLPDSGHTLSERLSLIHIRLLQTIDSIDRISVVLYDRHTDDLRTYVDSSLSESQLYNYQARLSDVPSLKEIADSGKARIINDIPAVYSSKKKHSAIINKEGYLSSYTIPLKKDNSLYGFLFANSKERGLFCEEIISQLDTYLALIGNFVINDINLLKVLSGSISTLNHVSRYRDPETGAHLSRMSHFAHLIAQEIAPLHELSDELVEHIKLFAPLHDVGKIAIPDSILLKPGKLTDEEFEKMKRHTLLGTEIIDKMVGNLELGNIPFMSVLTNIVKYHHEKVDGSGYPEQLQGEEIPLEARIVAIADVFDALTSERPYKQAWSNEDAFSWMKKEGRQLFDQHLLSALEENKEQVNLIQTQFVDEFDDWNTSKH
jgi:two-component system response regulator RpfG